jgi:hypothetical protein
LSGAASASAAVECCVSLFGPGDGFFCNAILLQTLLLFLLLLLLLFAAAAAVCCCLCVPPALATTHQLAVSLPRRQGRCLPVSSSYNLRIAGPHSTIQGLAYCCKKTAVLCTHDCIASQNMLDSNIMQQQILQATAVSC